MNYRRVLRVANGYFLFTGYHIRSLDNKSRRYSLSLWSVLYFLILFLIYIICFEHHFEKSAILKIMLDLSPFLKNLIIVQIWLGLKVFIVCMIEWRSLTKLLNGLVGVLMTLENDNSAASDKRSEILAYIMFFSTFVVALCFGLYIAIEMKFELPPVDHIMIGMALFIPHFTLAGSLRLHNLSLWLLGKELESLKDYLNVNKSNSEDIVIEIINPIIKINSEEIQATATPAIPSGIHCRDILKGVVAISSYLSSFNVVLQRQMCLLNALNFNCLLNGIYSHLYFNKTWNVVFVGRNRRVFYASNTAIFVCIFLDYFLLMLMQINFDKIKTDFSKEVSLKVEEFKNPAESRCMILKDINRVLRDKLNLKLFGFVDFNLWNFLILQCLMLLIIAIIVLYQYFNDQVVALTQLIESDFED